MPETPVARTFIIDPNPLFCDEMRACLIKSGHVVVGQAQTLQDARDQLDSLQPDLLIVGPHVAEEGLGICRELSKRLPTLKIILFTAHASEPLFLADAANVGVAACLPPQTTESELLEAVAKVMAGQRLFSQEILSLAFQPIELTRREHEVLKLMAEGKTDREIADGLGVNFHTVRNHTRHILEKFNVHTRQEAVWRARHRGMV